MIFRRALLGALRRRSSNTAVGGGGVSNAPCERGLRANMVVAEAHLSEARPFVAKSAPRIAALTAYFRQDGSWEDPGAAAPLARELAALEATSKQMASLERRLSDARELCARRQVRAALKVLHPGRLRLYCAHPYVLHAGWLRLSNCAAPNLTLASHAHFFLA